MKLLLELYLAAGFGSYLALWCVNFGTLQENQMQSSIEGILCFAFGWPYLIWLLRNMRMIQITASKKNFAKAMKLAEMEAGRRGD